jgi:hypothetical protein
MIEQDVDDPARILAGSDALCRGAHRRRHHQHHAASYDGAFRDQTAAQILSIPTDTDCVVARPRDAAWAEGQSRKSHQPPTKSIGAFYCCRSRIAMLDANKIDHPDRPETTEGHHANHNTDDIGPDQRGEDEGQRAARTPRCRPRSGRHPVDRSRDGRARADARQQDAAR